MLPLSGLEMEKFISLRCKLIAKMYLNFTHKNSYQGSKFYKFDPKKRPPVSSGYPKPIENWEGVPNNLDAAAQISGVSYFFKEGQYWRFDDETSKV